MTYSRSCGVSLAACGANECRCVPVDPEPVNGREKPAQRFGALHDAGLLADPADRDDAAEDLVSVKVEVPLLRARLKRVEAERDQLRRWKAEAIPVMFGLQDLGKALGVRLGTRITGEAAAEQARALKAERDHAQEVAELAEKDRRTYHRDAIRAEAEVAELEHRLACLLCELTGGRMSKTNYDVRTMVQEVEAYFERTVDDDVTELRATVERCKALADEWDRTLQDTLRVEIDELRAALDGAGEQS